MAKKIFGGYFFPHSVHFRQPCCVVVIGEYYFTKSFGLHKKDKETGMGTKPQRGLTKGGVYVEAGETIFPGAENIAINSQQIFSNYHFLYYKI